MTTDPTETAPEPERAIAFQGVPGAYSHMACRQAYPEHGAPALPLLRGRLRRRPRGRARLAMIPVDNSVAGRVADVHHLLPRGGLHIIGECFVRVNHHLLGVRGRRSRPSARSRSTSTRSASAAGSLRLRLRARVAADTAGAAERRRPRRRPDPRRHRVPARRRDLRPADPQGRHRGRRAQHHPLPRPRPRPRHPGPADGPLITTFIFRVRNRPAALYKALGGFATNGVNMIKLESYIDSAFTQAAFYADVMGHPATRTSASPSRSCASSPTTSRSWASTPPIRSASG